MSPIAFYIGNFAITWYAILIMIAIVSVSSFSYWEWRKKGLNPRHFEGILIGSIIIGLFGARWMHIIMHPEEIATWTSGIEMFNISGGRTIFGSILFPMAFVFIMNKVTSINLDLRTGFSIVLPNVLFAQAIGRWGNFANQEVYGQVVESINWLPTGISNQMFIDGAYRFPLFFVEFITNLIGFILIGLVMKSFDYFKSGTHAAMYFVWYGISRASMEGFRDPRFMMMWGNVSSAMVVASLFAVFGAISFVWLQWFDGEVTYYQDELNYKFQIKSATRRNQEEAIEQIKVNLRQLRQDKENIINSINNRKGYTWTTQSKDMI